MNRLTAILARRAFASLIHVVRWSSKMEIHGWENVNAAYATGRPMLFVFWHGGIVPILLFRQHVQLPFLTTMVSRSRDGEVAAELARGFGTESIRASSSKGGAAGLLKFIDELTKPDPAGVPRAGFHLVDGPRGPRRKVKPGVVTLAQKSNALVLPISIGIARRIVARSWDRHRIPLPFGRCVYLIGAPIDLNDPANANFQPEDLERIFDGLAATHPLCARDEALN